MQLVPNLIGLFVYTDGHCPRFDPPKLLGIGERYYINPADVGWFYRWEAAQRPIVWSAHNGGADGCVVPRGWMVRR